MDKPIIDQKLLVIRMIALGYTRKEIADQLSLSVKTVDYHYTAAKKEHGLESDADFTRFATIHKIIVPGETRNKSDERMIKVIDAEICDYQSAKAASLVMLTKAANGEVPLPQIRGWTAAVDAHVRLVESEIKLQRLK